MDDVKWLIAREIPHLRRYALALVGEPHAADDVVQDCLERALRKRSLWRREGSIRSWLYKILYNEHLQRLRRRRPTASLENEEIDLPTPALQESALHCHDIAEALQALPADQRAAILLVALEGMSYDAAAEILDVPIGTVRSRLSRGRAALREAGVGSEQEVRLRRLK